MVKRTSIILLAAVSLLIGLSTLTRAADEKQAAVVVAFGDGTFASRCVSFSEPEISGFDLLQRSGLAVVVEDQSAGAVVCRIADTGCPADDCLCQCRGGGDCIYWSYWHQLGGEWAYSAAGSSIFRIEDGAVDGWSWGPGSVAESIPPPPTTFDEVCGAEPTSTLTPSVTPTPLVVASLVGETSTPQSGDETATVRPAVSPTSGTPALAATPGSAVPATIDPSELTATQAVPIVQPLPSPTLDESAGSLSVTSQPAPLDGPSDAAQPATPPEIPTVEAYPSPMDSGGGAPSEPVDALGQAGLIVPAIPTSAMNATATIEIAAIMVIGSGVEPNAEPATAAMIDEAASTTPVNGLPYTGLAVLLLALGILAAVARLRVVKRDSN